MQKEVLFQRAPAQTGSCLYLPCFESESFPCRTLDFSVYFFVGSSKYPQSFSPSGWIYFREFRFMAYYGNDCYITNQKIWNNRIPPGELNMSHPSQHFWVDDFHFGIIRTLLLRKTSPRFDSTTTKVRPTSLHVPCVFSEKRPRNGSAMPRNPPRPEATATWTKTAEEWQELQWDFHLPDSQNGFWWVFLKSTFWGEGTFKKQKRTPKNEIEGPK